MEVLSSRTPLGGKTSLLPAKRALMQSGEPSRKKRLMSADSFCFSLEDLTARLHNENDSNSSDQEDSPDENEFCFWCDAKRYQDSFKCPYHSNKEVLDKEKDHKSKPYAYRNIPDMLQLYSANTPEGVRTGLRAVNVLPVGAWIGPFEGTFVQREEIRAKNNYMWEIFKDGKLSGYIDGSDENKSSWMRFIRRTSQQKEQNLGAFQYQEKIYYRVHKTIRPGQELLVWYDQQYTRFLTNPRKDDKKVEVNQGETTVSPLNSPQENTASQQRQQVLEMLRGVVGNTSKTSGQNAVHMETSFRRIGALSQSSMATQTQSEPAVSSNIGTTDSLPARPIPQVSTGFSLKIANGNLTKTPEPSPVKVLQTTSTPSVPSPTSPSTPTSESDFSTESESPSKDESIGPSAWRCGQCQKSFAQRAMLQVHVCYKVPFRPYKCGHCDRSFSNPGEMRAHAVVHQGKKPFKCGYCSRAFSGATTLNNHIRIHTGEKPFKCEKCGKTFSQGSQLSKHGKIPGDCIP